ncbi:MAG: polysaccharide deacetylase family protein [Flavobacteriales bacterium]|nr:polysaccharide deacetylase family protein [Flavobacteriales bacterium]
MILIYSHKLTPRLRYIFKTIFIDVLQTQISFTDNAEEFEKSESVKINYSTSKLNSGLFFQSSSILFETGIKEQNINVFEFEEHQCFFSVGNDSEFSFDPFAASFYLISRYEEYLPHIKDNHERFLASESLAFQNKFLDKPLVNNWINEIAKRIENQSPEFRFPKRDFQFISTIDIDNAYAYKHKGFIRILGGLVKSLFKENNFNNRLKVIFGKKLDPYDTFNYQFEVHKKYNISPIYFFLLGDYGLNDKNIPVKNKTFQSLIKSISDYSEVGIHPSYASNNNIETLSKEIKRLQAITHRNVVKSRQHFLKLNLPNTYRNLIDNDIESDYTMGYAEQNGFRASICSPYYFYDLDTEVKTKLKIYPFTVMEATYQYYEHSTPEEAINYITELMTTVKEVNGTFISVWHNESLSDEGIWKGWKIVYEKMLKESLNKN